jgi:Cellulase (glycosyl hydrolase family 5)
MRRFRLILPLLVALVALGSPVRAVAAPDRLDIGIGDPLEDIFDEQDPNGAYDAIKRGGIQVVRVPMPWSVIAGSRPSHPRDPDDPAYNWSRVEDRLQEIRSHGLTPMLVVFAAPTWAAGGKGTASPSQFADFLTAATKRYDGEGGEPRVRYWELWNEPDLYMFLDDTPEHYRAMVNAGYKAVHAVRKDNVAVAGGMSPFGDPKDEFGIAPFRYMSRVLCMSRGAHPHPTCKAKISFDVWSHHPYTSGGPNHSAPVSDEASMGDLPEMHRMLVAAKRAGHIRSRGALRFWITEFSWDTDGPDPGGVPLARHARWVAEALYRMWQSGVSMMVWFQLRDNPAPDDGNWRGTFQAGLYFRTTRLYRDERVKPFAHVLEFPFVALPASRGAVVWGRRPHGRRGPVVLERRVGKKWRRVGVTHSNAHGIFFRRVSVRRGSLVRARAAGQTARPFRAVKTKDVEVNAFGGTVGG